MSKTNCLEASTCVSCLQHTPENGACFSSFTHRQTTHSTSVCQPSLKRSVHTRCRLRKMLLLDCSLNAFVSLYHNAERLRCVWISSCNVHTAGSDMHLCPHRWLAPSGCNKEFHKMRFPLLRFTAPTLNFYEANSEMCPLMKHPSLFDSRKQTDWICFIRSTCWVFSPAEHVLL